MSKKESIVFWVSFALGMLIILVAYSLATSIPEFLQILVENHFDIVEWLKTVWICP